MATSVARKAAMPSAVTLARAWKGMPPPLCAPLNQAAEPLVVHLPLDAAPQLDAAAGDSAQGLAARQKPAKSFHMHVGGALHIPTRDAQDLPQLQQAAAAQRQAEGVDPFEGLPFRGMAERLGEALLPSLQAAQDAERAARRANTRAAEEAEVAVPHVPHVLPFTRWAATSQQFRSTFIADPPKQRKKARLSWYHPDDTMVPRGWLSQGLLADMAYYMPFGLGGATDHPREAPSSSAA